MKVLLVIIAVFGTPASSSGEECTDLSGKSLFFLDQKMKWAAAEAFCANQYANGHLPSQQSYLEAQALAELLEINKPNELRRPVWIGAFADKDNNEFAWTDGRPFNFTNWAFAFFSIPPAEFNWEIFADSAVWFYTETNNTEEYYVVCQTSMRCPSE